MSAEETLKTSELSRIKKLMAGPARRRVNELYAADSRLPKRIENPRSRRAVTKQLISALREINGGRIDYRALEREFAEIAAKDAEMLNATARALRQAAVKKSGAAQRFLAADMASRLKGLEELVAVAATVDKPKYHLPKAPFEIVPSAGMTLQAAEIISVKSFVKFHIELDRKSTNGTVEFNYLWQNLDGKFAVINVDGYMIFHGHGFVSSGSGFCGGSRAAGYRVDGEIGLLQFCDDPPTQPLQQTEQNVTVSALSVRTDRIGSVGALEQRDIFRGYDLRHALLIVPPGGVLVISQIVTVDCDCGSDSGIVDLDFASGEFNIGSPGVLVTILS